MQIETFPYLCKIIRTEHDDALYWPVRLPIRHISKDYQWYGLEENTKSFDIMPGDLVVALWKHPARGKYAYAPFWPIIKGELPIGTLKWNNKTIRRFMPYLYTHMFEPIGEL